MKPSHLVPIICLLLAVGCSKNDNPVIGNNDDLLKSQLLGTWKSGLYTKQFNQDNTFIDSISNYYGESPSTMVLDFVARGQYSITDSIIYYSNCQLVFADSTHWAQTEVGKGELFYAAKLNITNNILHLTSTEPFTQTSGLQSELKGVWISHLWFVGIERSPIATMRQGTVSTTYTFNTDSSKYQFVQTDSFDSPYYQNSGSYSFTYAPPFLNTVNNTNILVEFSRGSMLWTYDWGGYSYTKTK